MKKRYCITAVLLLFPLLCSCGLLPSYRDVGQLLVIQTMGVDQERGGVRLSLASAADRDGTVKRLSERGASISAAMDGIDRLSTQNTLFCHHVSRVLLGEETAERGVDACLDYICRSPVMRADMPMYVVRDHTAAELISDSGSAGTGISELLQSAEQRLERLGGMPVTTAAELLRCLERYGSALVYTLRFTDAAELPTETETESGTDGGDDGDNGEDGAEETGSAEKNNSVRTAELYGYAVLRDGKLCRYLDSGEAMAADILTDQVGIYTVELRDGLGSTATLEIDGGSTRILPLWNGGTLTGFDVRTELNASLLESGGAGNGTDSRYLDRLCAALETEIADRENALLQTEKSLQADFLGLYGIVERHAPFRYEGQRTEFLELLPTLTQDITVSVRLRHTSDMDSE